MLDPMRDTMVTVEEAVESLWPAAVGTAAVALIPKEANQMPAPLDRRPITVTCFLYNFSAGRDTIR